MRFPFLVRLGSRASTPSSHLSARSLVALLAVFSFGGLTTGCINHLNNARVRGADEFECKRDEVQVTEVADHIFVARGCGQVGAYRCEAGLEGGCKKLQGKAGDKAIALAPEAAVEDADKPKKKKKKKADDGDETSETSEKSAKGDAETKPSKGDSSEKSSKASNDDPETDGEKQKKKKKKKSDDE